MSTLSMQCDELREAAGRLEGYNNGEISDKLREAADIIESLRNTLQELQGVGSESRYTALFGTPERAARTLEKGKTLCAWCDKQTCSTNGGECRIFDYDSLLEWLKGDARWASESW